MKYTKSTTFAVAFIMLAVGCAAFIGFPSDADPVQVNDETVNVYFDGSGSWTSGEYEVFNVFEAIQAASPSNAQGLYYEVVTGEDDWTETTAANGTYPNPEYGTIWKVGYTYYDEYDEEDVTEGITTDFTIYGYDTIEHEWRDITPYAMGWIRPFTDYKMHAELVYNDNVVSWATAFANIAVQMQSTTDVDDIIPDQTLLPLKSLTDPSTRTDCSYTFILKDVGYFSTYANPSATFYGRTVSADANAVQLDLDDLSTSEGITVFGYGSDAYLALFHAVNGAVPGQEETYEKHYNPQLYYTNYSWMEYLFGVGTYKTEYGTGYIYDYWASYKVTGTGNLYTAFNLGYHTNIPGSYSHDFPGWGTGFEPYYCNGNTFVLQYERSYPPTS